MGEISPIGTTSAMLSERTLARLFNGVAGRQGPGQFTPWTGLIDRVDIASAARFLVVCVYYSGPGDAGQMVPPNTLPVHE